jgi:hypothetical protein
MDCTLGRVKCKILNIFQSWRIFKINRWNKFNERPNYAMNIKYFLALILKPYQHSIIFTLFEHHLIYLPSKILREHYRCLYLWVRLGHLREEMYTRHDASLRSKRNNWTRNFFCFYIFKLIIKICTLLPFCC